MKMLIVLQSGSNWADNRPARIRTQEVFALNHGSKAVDLFQPSQKFERLPLYSIDGTGKVSLEPDGSNWVFSASVRYCSSPISKKDVNQQTYPRIHISIDTEAVSRKQQPDHLASPVSARFADTSVRNDEHHLILDFQAGKDVGLGMFGAAGTDHPFLEPRCPFHAIQQQLQHQRKIGSGTGIVSTNIRVS